PLPHGRDRSVVPGAVQGVPGAGGGPFAGRGPLRRAERPAGRGGAAGGDVAWGEPGPTSAGGGPDSLERGAGEAARESAVAGLRERGGEGDGVGGAAAVGAPGGAVRGRGLDGADGETAGIGVSAAAARPPAEGAVRIKTPDPFSCQSADDRRRPTETSSI